MQFDWWTFAFQVVNVLILMWLLSHFLFRPVAGMIAERRAETSRALAAAEAAKQRATEAETAALAEKKKNAAERLAIIQAAREEAEAQKNGILDQARKTAAGIGLKAEERYRTPSRGRPQGAAGQGDRACRHHHAPLLGHLPDDARVAGYPERLKAALIALDPEQREALSGDPGALRLVAPRALSDTELAAATDAIRAAIAAAPTPAVDLDETLIAGLELSGRHGVIHNSLKYDLERIAEALEKNDQI